MAENLRDKLAEELGRSQQFNRHRDTELAQADRSSSDAQEEHAETLALQEEEDTSGK
jgi:hypothetical protein